MIVGLNAIMGCGCSAINRSLQCRRGGLALIRSFADAVGKDTQQFKHD